MADVPAAAPAEPSTTPHPPQASTKPRLWPAIVILAIGGARLAWIWFGMEPDTTVQTIATYLTVLPMILALGLWWTFFSRVRWRTRFLGWGILAACGIIAGCLVRIDGVTGEVTPMLAWRWSPNRQAVAAAYLAKQTSVPDAPATSAESKEPERLVVKEGDWPEYRGRLRDGIARNDQIRTDWETNPPQALWRHPVGLGWASFVIVDGLAFTQEQRDTQEVVVCYDAKTGEQRWIHNDVARFSEALGGDGPRATPTVYDGRIYTLGATGVLNCLEARTGQKIWSHDVLIENAIPNIPWGMSGSPLVYDDVVVINPGGPNQQGLMAFDRLTGKPVWNAGTDVASYCALQLNEVDGVRQILLCDGIGIAGHDAQDGKQLWKFPWSNSPKVNASQPFVFPPDRVLISNGYGVGSAMLQVKHEGDQWTVTTQWESKRLKLKFNSGVVHGDYIYGLDEGILVCFDWVNNKLKWRGGRYGFGQTILVDDWLVCLTESGELTLVKATPEAFTETAKFQAIEGRTWNSPALWQGLLLIRNGDEAACYDLRPKQ